MPYYYLVKLPEDMISEELKTGEIQPKWWVPPEDLYTGWEKSGKVGQEIYGDGLLLELCQDNIIRWQEKTF